MTPILSIFQSWLDYLSLNNKNNSKYGKNLIGTFYQPNLVISDTIFLKSLPKRELVCGYGEILKHSIIADKKFFAFLDKNASKILNLKSPFLEKAICDISKFRKKYFKTIIFW